MSSDARPNEVLLIGVLLLTSLAHVLDFVIVMPLGPKLMTEFDISAAVFGNIVSVYTIAAAASSFLSALWLDRVDKKAGILVLLVGFSVGNGFCAWAPTVEILLFGRVVAGIFGGVMQALVYSIISQAVSAKRQGRAAGVIGTSFPIVSILGIPFGLRLADFYGWHMAFILVLAMSILAFVMSLIVLPALKPVKKGAPGLISPLKGVWAHVPHRVGFLLIFLIVMGGFVIVPYIAPFLIMNEYIREDQLYLIYLVGGIFAILTSRFVGIMADRFGKVAVLRVLLVLSAPALLFFANLPHGEGSSLAIVLVSTTALMMVLPGRIVCAMAWMTTIGHPERRGAFLSLISTGQQLTIGLATIVGGALVGEAADGTFATFWMAGTAAVTANMLVLVLSPVLARHERQAIRKS